jgi:hypothetical protein
MGVRNVVSRRRSCCLSVAALAFADEPKKKDESKKEPEKKQYKPGDMSRPRPKVVDPGTTTPAETHGNPVRYRNIWVRKLGEYDGTPPPEKNQ